MTNKEALSAVIGVTVTDQMLTKALLDHGIIGADPYKAANGKDIDLSAIDVLKSLILGSVTEGGYSITIDRTAVEARLKYLAGKYGISGVLEENTITNRSNRW